jgi:hypothetical protein
MDEISEDYMSIMKKFDLDSEVNSAKMVIVKL